MSRSKARSIFFFRPLRPGTDVHHQVRRRPDHRRAPEELAEPPAEAVPDDGRTGLLRDRHPEAGAGPLPRTDEEDQPSPGVALPGGIRLQVVRAPENPALPPERLRRPGRAPRGPGPAGVGMHRVRRPAGSGGAPVASDREALPALGAAAGEDGAAVLRPHPDEEAVLLAAAAIVGLERSLHGTTSPVRGARAADSQGVSSPGQPAPCILGAGTGQFLWREQGEGPRRPAAGKLVPAGSTSL